MSGMVSPTPGAGLPPEPERIPLSPDLRAIGSVARIPAGDARDTVLHDPGGLAPMPIRKLPEPPDSLKAWRAWGSGAPGVMPARKKWPRR